MHVLCSARVTNVILLQNLCLDGRKFDVLTSYFWKTETQMQWVVQLFLNYYKLLNDRQQKIEKNLQLFLNKDGHILLIDI